MAVQSPVLTQRIWGAFNPQTNLLVGIQTTGEGIYQHVPNENVTPTFAGARLTLSAASNLITTLGKTTQADGLGASFVFNPLDTTSGCVCLGSIAGTVLTVASVTSGAVAVGLTVSSGVTGAPIATVTSFGTGGGGVGTYNLSGPASFPLQTQFLLDNNSTVLVSTDGSRWYLQTTAIAPITAVIGPPVSGTALTVNGATTGVASSVVFNPPTAGGNTLTVNVGGSGDGVYGLVAAASNANGIAQTTRGIALTAADAAASTSDIGLFLSQPYNSGTAQTGILRMKRGTGNTYNGMEIGTTNATPFRIFTNGATEDSGVAMTFTTTQDVVARGVSFCKFKSADTGRTTVVPSNDPDLIYVIPAAGTYRVELLINVTGGGTTNGGINCAVNYTGTFTSPPSMVGVLGNVAATTVASQSRQILSSASSTNIPFATLSATNPADWFSIVGYLIATAGGGTLGFNWAQAAANGTTSVRQGSHLLVTQLS